MSLHPDADAFVQAILRDPAEVTTRLVFADWLEETGDPSNVAWARYMRSRAELHQYPPNSFERSNREWHSANVAVLIEATVPISVPAFLTHHQVLQDLLPLEQFVVNLDKVEIPSALLDLIPERYARENHVLLLDRQELVVIIAVENPHDWDLRDQLRYLVNGTVIAVQAAVGDIDAALDRLFVPRTLEQHRFIRLQHR